MNHLSSRQWPCGGRRGIVQAALGICAFIVLTCAADVAFPCVGTRLIAAHPSAEDRRASLSDITTTHSFDGLMGDDDWFVSPVTVTLSVMEGGPVTATLFRLDDGEWMTYTTPFVVATDGRHVLEYYSVRDEETEAVHAVPLAIDTTAPSSTVLLLPPYQYATTFLVTWGGNDNGGSGIIGYDVHYKSDLLATWRPWLTGTSSVAVTFGPAERGRVYYFRVRARDAAGNVEVFREGRGDAATFVNSVYNGDFETGNFDGWTVGGEMSKTVTIAAGIGGQGMWSALLGSPLYGDSITPTAAMHVPTDTYAAVSQVIAVPNLYDIPSPALRLWYRMQTYDVLWGCTYPDRLFDSFEVIIRDGRGITLSIPVRDGNTDCETYNAYMERYGIPPFTDIVRERVVDLSPYAGQTIIVELRNVNRQDWSYNTWTFVDSVMAVNRPVYLYRAYLPAVGAGTWVDQTPTRRSSDALPIRRR